ncbi:MAG: tol-pal system-associated acyl-CoA thioesterase [Gammaproteobacteria bacterium RBG_16_51_14]|nr:MAG: tol-pal system-associated acyl-CoA thioesterase [Gammaproteobacteria bacterium RBG_16_51_14]
MNDFSWPVRVYYEDTDAGGVVYYANYLRFMERARSEWLRSLGHEQDRLIQEEKIIFAVRQVTIDYHKPARFNDMLNVNTTIQKKRGASLYFLQTIRNQQGELLCQAMVKIACLNAETMKPRPLPDTIFAGLRNVD